MNGLKPAIEVDKLSKLYPLETVAGLPWPSPVRGLSRAFRRGGRSPETFWALKEVSFVVERRAIVALIGPNGSGKTTLLRILSRIIRPSSGRAIVRGRISALLQFGTGFHPDLSGRQNVYMNGMLLGMSRSEIRARFRQIADFSGIGRFIDSPVRTYSRGMYTRLAFSIAAHLEPDILFLDEVFAVGDTVFMQKSYEKLTQVSRSGCTVLMVSHHLGRVEELCGHAIYLKAGQVAAQGSAAEMRRLYEEEIREEEIRQEVFQTV